MMMVQVSEPDLNIQINSEEHWDDTEAKITDILPKILIEVWKYQEFILKKRKTSGYLYLYGSHFCQGEKSLELRSCLHDPVVNDAPRIGKYNNKD